MNAIVSFAGQNLPSVANLKTALSNLKSDVGGSGMVMIKMDKTGHWVYGADQTEVEDDSLWAINPFSFIHGFIAWGEGEVLGEMMASISQPLPETPAIPPGAKKGWELQVGMSLQCISGEDNGLEVRYTATSVGGKKAVQALANEIAAQVDKDPVNVVPVVTLDKEYYQHKQYGRIYTPVLEVTKWISMAGDTPKEEEAPTEVEAEATPDMPVRRRRRAA